MKQKNIKNKVESKYANMSTILNSRWWLSNFQVLLLYVIRGTGLEKRNLAGRLGKDNTPSISKERKVW